MINFKIAWRNLSKNKTFSVINICGLSLGIAAFLMIVNYLRFEYSYDDFHEHKDRIFRVPMVVEEKDGKEQTFAFNYPALAPALKKDFPEIEEVVRLRRRSGIVKSGDRRFSEGGIYFADAAFFKIFSFPILKGETGNPLSALNDVVITASTEKKYFGNENAIGKTLHYDSEDYLVKAVVADPPTASHFHFDILLNYEKYVVQTQGRANTSWGWSDFYTYVLLKKGTSVKNVEARLPDLAQRYMGDEMKASGFQVWFKMQPLKDIHLNSIYDYEFEGNGNFTYLNYLILAALFILFIAWINYVNLSTAYSIDRAKEVGVRKVIGAGKSQLVFQFLGESFFINITAICIGIFIFLVALPHFATLVNKPLIDLHKPGVNFWIFSILLFLVGTTIAAFYPAFVLSSFQPIQSLKNSRTYIGGKSGKNLLRQSLVVVQFVAAILLIAGATGFYRQLRFMQNRDLGVNIKQTLVLQQTGYVDSARIPAFNALMNDLSAHPGIISVAASSSVPGGEVGGSSGFRLKNSTVDKRCRLLGIDNKFIPAYGLTIISGRNFTTDKHFQDSATRVNILVNETAAKVFGFSNPSQIVGKELQSGDFNCVVIGLVKDYHQESLEFAFDPTVFYPGAPDDLGNVSLKLNTSNLPELMKFAENTWKKNMPDFPFQYFFLDDHFNQQYNNDRQFASVLWIFTFIAIVIACLGLFALSLFTIAKRAKEISIRKVLGASIVQLTRLITVDYFKLIAIAGFVAIPLAYLMVSNWLQKYEFHISIGLWFFILPVGAISLIALITVLWQSIRAAVSNPIKSLKSE
jgi:putative ABC transport system permease protein